jgi:hypothetical protein
VKLGVIVERGERQCTATGMTVLCYETTDDLPSGKIVASLSRPKPAQVRALLAEARQRHKEAPFSPDAVSVLRWLGKRFNVQDEKP